MHKIPYPLRIFWTLAALMLSMLGTSYPALGQMTVVDSLRKEMTLVQDNRQRVQILCDLSKAFNFVHADSAKLYGEWALREALHNGLEDLEATAHHYIGISYGILGQYSDALAHFDSSLTIYERHRNGTGVGMVFNNMGIVYHIQGNMDKALDYYLRSLRVHERLGDSLAMSNSLVSIGIIYRDQGDLQRAFTHALRAHAIINRAKDKVMLRNSLTLLADLHYAKREWGKAIAYYNEGVELAKSVGDAHQLAHNYAGLANVYVAQGDYAAAGEHFSRAIVKQLEVGDKEANAHTLRDVAGMYRRQGLWKQSIQYADDCLGVATELGSRTLAKAACELLFANYASLGDYEKAFLYQSQYVQLKDSLFSFEKDKEITRLMLARKETEFAMLTAEVQKAAFEKKAWLAMSVLMIAIVVIVLVAWHQKQKSHRLLNQTNEELKKLNEKKNEFLGIAAHDLRNPLGMMQLYLDFITRSLRDEQPDTESALEDLEKASSVIRQMSGLINELLDITAIESGKIRLDLRETNLADLLSESERLYRKMAEQKKIDLTYVSHSTPIVLADQAKVQSVIDNLVANAIKYTHPGGTVRLFTENKDREVVTHVEDTGQGLSGDDLANVFSTFGKLSARPTGGESSTGLGLAIVKKIIEMHGGRVWVHSARGKGSIFSFSLPVSLRQN